MTKKTFPHIYYTLLGLDSRNDHKYPLFFLSIPAAGYRKCGGEQR